MATVLNTPQGTSPPSGPILNEGQYKPVHESLALRGLKGIAGITYMLGATVIFISPLAIIAFITFFGDRFVGTPHPDSIWFVFTTFSKMAAICMVVLTVVGAICAVIFILSHLIHLSAKYFERISTEGQSNTDILIEIEPIGVFDRRVALERQRNKP